MCVCVFGILRRLILFCYVRAERKRLIMRVLNIGGRSGRPSNFRPMDPGDLFSQFFGNSFFRGGSPFGSPGGFSYSPHGNAGGTHDPFAEMFRRQHPHFGSEARRRTPSQGHRPAPLRIELPISLREFYRGVEKRISIARAIR